MKNIVIVVLAVFWTMQIYANGVSEITWEAVDDTDYLKNSMLKEFFVLQRATNPPYQPYPFRYVLKSSMSDEGIVFDNPSQVLEIVDQWPSFSERNERRSLFMGIVFYVSVLVKGYPHRNVRIVEKPGDIPNLSIDKAEDLHSVVSPYQETLSANEIFGTGYFWTPIDASLYQLTLEFKDAELVDLGLVLIENSLGDADGLQ